MLFRWIGMLATLPAESHESLVSDRNRRAAHPTPTSVDERGRLFSDSIDYHGRFTYGLDSVEVFTWDQTTRLRVGSFNSIAGGVTAILGGNHRTDWLTTFPFGHIFQQIFPEGQQYGARGHPASKGDILVANDVWIGHGSTLLSGSSLENGAVLAAQSVLTNPTEPYGVYAGAPARLVRKRFDEGTIAALLELAWWDWPVVHIRSVIPILQQPLTPRSLERLFQGRPTG